MKHHAAPHHDLMDSATYRQQYRLAWEQWLAELDFDLFVTLNFNRDTTPAGARRMLGLFMARLDRRFLGRRWCRKGPERTFGVAVPACCTDVPDGVGGDLFRSTGSLLHAA